MHEFDQSDPGLAPTALTDGSTSADTFPQYHRWNRRPLEPGIETSTAIHGESGTASGSWVSMLNESNICVEWIFAMTPHHHRWTSTTTGHPNQMRFFLTLFPSFPT